MMMERKKIIGFRLRTWHFVLAFLILVIFINVIGKVDFNDTPEIKNSYLIELENHSFSDSISNNGICYVLFYTENSKFCNKMEHNINQIKEDINGARLYKVNIDNNINHGMSQNVLSVPTILIYKDGQEVDRIMGLVPVSNLKMINKRIGG